MQNPRIRARETPTITYNELPNGVFEDTEEAFNQLPLDTKREIQRAAQQINERGFSEWHSWFYGEHHDD